uniref:Caspase-9 n=1 Tax=Petromyzon marinus TaxID=7757 RepID=A0AAJ7X1L4_PETMA|nr:caspase-9 [Petromyzon marinus]XP_032818165.1 caspase-9 [Petromyzon marinus]
MDEQHRLKLRRLRVTLVKDLDPKALYDYLVANDIFSDDMIEEIHNSGTRRERASKMLMELEKRGSRALPIFIEALDDSKQSHLADIIREELASDKIDARRRSLPILPIEPQNVPGGAPDFFPDVKQKEGAADRDEHREYPMKASPRGKCLIINNMEFMNLKSRLGSDIDCAKIIDMFTNNFHFDVIVKENLSKKEMLGALKSLSADDHTKADCCVVVIMSHGREIEHRRFPGAVFGTDDLFVRMEDIVSFFSGTDCPSLLGKPKLFFIQACGGDEKDRGAQVAQESDSGGGGDDDSGDHVNGDAPSSANAMPSELPEPDDEPDASPVYSEQARNQSQDETDATPHLPSMSDMLVAYSSLPGFVSWRDCKQGSWFIQVMLEVFKKHAVNEDLISMITLVNEKLSNEYQAKGVFKQTSSPLNTLRKRLYFNPTF